MIGGLGSLPRARRRRAGLVVGVMFAASAGFSATAIIVSSHHPSSALPTSAGGRQGDGGGGDTLVPGAPVPASDLVSDPVFVTSTIGFALETTERGSETVERLATSRDGGKTWSVTGASFPVQGGYSTLQFIAPGEGFIFGDAGLLVTSNAGKSWLQVAGLSGLQRAIPIGENVWATFTSRCSGPPIPDSTCKVGVAVSTDGGRAFRDVSPPGLTEAMAGGDVLARYDLETAYLLSYGVTGGGLAFTDDGGRSWQRLADPCSGDAEAEDLAAPPPDGDLWLVCGAVTAPGAEGQLKSVYRSSNGGRRWTLVASTGFLSGEEAPVGHIPLSGSISQLATISPRTAWLGVRQVGVIVTFDGGRTWQLAVGIPTAQPDTDVGVTFNSSSLGWAVVFRRGVWRTEDGVHWKLMAGL